MTRNRMRPIHPGEILREERIAGPCAVERVRENRVNQSGSVALSAEVMRGRRNAND